MAERAHLSIGEVLALMQQDFPDVTISKIRFLESQGLLDPERTASGYRKFHDADIERLRFILAQQRDHFLPLRVIKGRLQGGDGDGVPTADLTPADVDRATRPGAHSIGAGAGGGEERAAGAAAEHGGVLTSRPPTPGPPTPVPLAPGPHAPDPLAMAGGGTGASFTPGELAGASGLTTEQLSELERYGLIERNFSAGAVSYDEDDLVVARIAAGFLRFGVEPRHLRVYKTSAEREAALFNQVVATAVHQRNPRAQQEATATLGELGTLGQTMRSVLLRRAVRQVTGR